MKKIAPARAQPFALATRSISLRICASLRQTDVNESEQPLAGRAFESTTEPANADEYAIGPAPSEYWVSENPNGAFPTVGRGPPKVNGAKLSLFATNGPRLA